MFGMELNLKWRLGYSVARCGRMRRHSLRGKLEDGENLSVQDEFRKIKTFGMFGINDFAVEF